jgi:hypothetical protein
MEMRDDLNIVDEAENLATDLHGDTTLVAERRPFRQDELPAEPATVMRSANTLRTKSFPASTS